MMKCLVLGIALGTVLLSPIARGGGLLMCDSSGAAVCMVPPGSNCAAHEPVHPCGDRVSASSPGGAVERVVATALHGILASDGKGELDRGGVCCSWAQVQGCFPGC